MTAKKWRRGAIAATAKRRPPAVTADPANVPGLLRRWRADTIAQANGSAVASWAALNGGVAWAQGTSAQQPTYQTSSINGLPAVRFVTDDQLNATITSQVQPITWVIVAKHNSIAGDQQFVYGGVEIQWFAGVSKYDIWAGASVQGGAATTSPTVLTAVVTGAGSVLYKDGTSVLQGNPGTAAVSATQQLGRGSGGSRPLNADIAEIILYDHALTPAERVTVHTYIQTRYAIACADVGGGVVEPPPPPPPPASATGDNGYGMMVFLNIAETANRDRDIAETVASGSSWIRLGIPEGVTGSIPTNGFTWSPNVANINFFVDTFRKAREAGLKTVACMADTIDMPWATEAQFNSTQSQYWTHIAQRLGPYVDLWQIFNEHDVQDYRNHAPIQAWNNSAYRTRWATTLAAARTALRVHSSAPMCTPLWGYPIDEAMYTRWQTTFDTIAPSLDVLGIHCYPEKSQTVIDRVPEYMNRLKARYGKDVAVLEFGLPSVPGYGTAPAYTEIGDAIVRQSLAIMSADPICATLFNLRNRGSNDNDTNGEMVFGIITNTFAPKPYYNPVVTMIKGLPREIPVSGLRGWWKADAIISAPADGAALLAWSDSSPNDRDMTGAVGFSPTYRATGSFLPSGKPVAEFNGTNQSLTATVPNNTAATISVLARWRTFNSPRSMFGSNDGFSLQVSAAGRLETAVANESWLTQTGAQLQVNTWYHIMFTTNGTNSHTTYVNNVQDLVSTTTVTPSATTADIGDNQTDQYHDGYIAEVINWSRVLSSVERAQVQTYLATKYGTLGVPSGGGNPSHVLDFDFDASENQADTGWLGWESFSAHQHARINTRTRFGTGFAERFEVHNNASTDNGTMGTIRSLMGVYNTNDGGVAGAGTPAGPADSYWCWSSYFPTSPDANAVVVTGTAQTAIPFYEHMLEVHERNGYMDNGGNINEVANHAVMIRNNRLEYRGRCGTWTWNGSGFNSPTWNTTPGVPGTNGSNDQIPIPIVKPTGTNATFPMNVWLDIILHVKFATNSTGQVNIWARQAGQAFTTAPNLAITGPTHKTVVGNDAVTRTSADWEAAGLTGCYMEVGLYLGSASWSDSNGSTAHVHIVDELRRWTTLAEAKANWG